MSNLGINGFDATGIEPSTDFEVIPAGTYVAEITASSMLPNSKGTGEYLKLEFTVLDGPYAGRKLWTQLNLINPSQQAVEIAQRDMSAICHAAGKLRVQDSIELHNIPMEIGVKVKSSEEYGPQNVIKGYKGIGSNAATTAVGGAPNWKRPAAQPSSNGNPPAPAHAATPTAPAPATSSPTPPWKKR